MNLLYRDKQFYKFSLYGFLKNLRFFEPFLILFFLEKGFSFFQIGILISIREISNYILEIPTGFIADIKGRKVSMLFSMISYIFSFLLFFFSGKFFLMIIAMIIFALGEAFRTGTHKALILSYLRINNHLDKKTEYYGKTRSFSQFGSAINALVAAGLVFYTGKYSIIFLASIIPYILNFFNLLSYPNYLDSEIIKKTKREFLKDFLSLFKKQESRSGILNASIFDSFFKTSKEYLQPILVTMTLSIPLLKDYDIQTRSSVLIGIVYFFLFLLTSFASSNSEKVCSRFKSKEHFLNLSYISGGIFLILIWIFLNLNVEYLSVIIFILLYILYNLRRPVNVSYLSEKFPRELMASGLSLESQMRMIFISILAPLMGYLVDNFGMPNSFLIIGIIMIPLIFFSNIKE